MPSSGSGEVREPGPVLAAVEPELLEGAVEPPGEGRRAAALVGEGEHPHAPRLPVVAEVQVRRFRGTGGRLPERRCDCLQIPGRLRAEERQRDVQVLGRDDSARPELAQLPRDEAVDDVSG